MSAWTIEYNGTTKTLEEWGVSGLSRMLRNQVPDEIAFTVDNSTFEADSVFPYGSTLRVYRDSVLWFVGLVVTLPRSMSAAAETHEVRAVGPRYHFDQRIYHTSRVCQVPNPAYDPVTNPTAPLTIAQTVYATMGILNISTLGAVMSTREQITDALNFLLSLFVDPLFQIGEILPARSVGPDAMYVPGADFKDLTIGDVVRNQLRWHPDAVEYFDYSTTPPTYHIRERDTCSQVSVSINPDAGHHATQFSLTPRYDLQRSGVLLRYLFHGSTNGQEQVNYVADAYPPTITTADDGLFISTIDLAGVQVAYVEGELLTEAIGTLPETDLDWWLTRIPGLRDERIDFTGGGIVAGSFERQDRDGNAVPLPIAYGYELLEGTPARWMRLGDGTPVVWEEETFFIKLKFTAYKDAAHTVKQETRSDQLFSVKVKTCNAPSGYYRTRSQFLEGDPQPVGLAEYLYRTLSTLAYEGQITIVEQECAGLVGMGKTLNLVDGRAEWQTMRAVVQTITEQVDTGSTVIRFGPPQHLSIASLIDLLKNSRQRRRWINPDTLSTSNASGSAVTRLGAATAISDSSGGGKERSLLVVSDAAVSGKITLDAAANVHTGSIAALELKGAGTDGSILVRILDCRGGTGSVAKELRVREVEVCVNNVTKKMLAICSLPYNADGSAMT